MAVPHLWVLDQSLEEKIDLWWSRVALPYFRNFHWTDDNFSNKAYDSYDPCKVPSGFRGGCFETLSDPTDQPHPQKYNIYFWRPLASTVAMCRSSDMGKSSSELRFLVLWCWLYLQLSEGCASISPFGILFTLFPDARHHKFIDTSIRGVPVESDHWFKGYITLSDPIHGQNL